MRNILLFVALSILVATTAFFNPTNDIQSVAINDKEVTISSQEVVIYDEVITENPSCNVQNSKSWTTMKADLITSKAKDVHINKNLSHLICVNNQMLRYCSVIQHSSNYL